MRVNGTSIAVERGLAEGAAVESWLDCGNRAWFENAPVALMRVETLPDALAREAAACAPVLHGGARLATIRDAIALRAAELAPASRRRAG